MLNQLTRDQAHLIAQRACVARNARDALLGDRAEDIAEEPHPARGERDRLGDGGYDVLPANDPAVTALRAAIDGLQPSARSELFALMRIGQGELAPGDWQRGLAEAETLGDEGIRGMVTDDIDLQSHVEKGLYELGAV